MQLLSILQALASLMDSKLVPKVERIQSPIADVGATSEIIFDNDVSIGLRITGDGSSAQYGFSHYGLTEVSPGSVRDKLLAKAIRAAKKASK